MTDSPVRPPASPAPASGSVPAADLASQLSARLCHDFVSPASAIVSGLDLLEDPSAQDMRADAMNLIAASARKLVALIAFSRVAFGSSVAAESFDSRELETLTRGVYEHVRPELAWNIAPQTLPKAPARALLNLAQIGATALPTGGVARLSIERRDDGFVAQVAAQGSRVRLRPETLSGLEGRPLDGGLGGHWVQAYFLSQLVAASGGRLSVATDAEQVVIAAVLPDLA